ncbi:hypothetical protein GC105_02205 [Alkalibaculum sp. M08DMB]|uniref:LiaI-LiaF-like transmembrane region domain-containing protein n=1 Tax=Alkalibaculum sporogenes TaxID=2655001 RepID=A0A6A7K5E0_9FIRM|nr:DUF5668 domain-containing protein [Alkalibaculum sporogenes]MPW24605.1 hypothetical protein [Alkalibaculum sporogenes]
MKNKNFVLGFILIALGSIWFLNNFNLIDFQLSYLIGGISDLWPLVLVVIGINLLIKNKVIEKFVWILFLIILISYSIFTQNNSFFRSNTNNYMSENQVYVTPIEDNIKKGDLQLQLGAMKFDITSGTSDFAHSLSNSNDLQYDTDVAIESQTLYIQNTNDVFKFNNSTNNYLDLDINESIPWDFNISCGAVDGSLDLQNINVEEFNLDMGAGRIEVDYGMKSKDSNININTGASQIILNFPAETGLKIKFEGALNSTNISNLNLIKEGSTYTSKNYEEADSKYNINVKMGLGDFTINY